MNKDIKDSAIHIVMSSSEEFAQYCNTCMASILYNVDNDYNVHFYILTLNLSKKNREKMNKIKNIKRCSIKYIDIDIDSLSMFDNINIPDHISIATYNRLLLPNILEDVKKVIYVDSDTIVMTDISKIFNQKTDGCSLAMVRDVESKIHAKRLWENSNDVYYNAGVMIMDLEKMRNSDYFEKIKNNIQTRSHLYIYADQDLINDTFKYDIKELDKYDNFHGLEYYYRTNKIPKSSEELKKIKSKIHIAHFTGAQKPWLSNKHLFTKEFIYYWKMTAFYKKILYQKFYTGNMYFKFISVFGHIIFYKSKSKTKRTYYVFGIKIHRRYNISKSKDDIINELLNRYESIIKKYENENKNLLKKLNDQREQIESGIIFNQYLNNTEVKKLQICSGKNYINGWLNTDLFYNKENQIGCLDVLKKFPFEDNTFNYIYSEHGIEHFEVTDFYKILLEVHRCLIPGGWFRIVTPDLEKLIKFYQEDSEINDQYLKLQANSYEQFLVERGIYNKCFVLNDFFRLWGHKNIYDQSALMEICRLAGFRNIRKADLQKSELADFTGIARHVVFDDFDINTFESMVIECQK